MFERVVQSPLRCLLWSGGLRSTLVLALLRQADIHVDIVTFGRDTMSKPLRKRMDVLIRDWGLKVFSYPPMSRSFMGDDTIQTVFDYAVGDAMFPDVRDVSEGTKCIAEIDGMQLHNAPCQWDCVVVGTEKEKEEWSIGTTNFIAPLAHWTETEVKAALEAFGLPTTEEDESVPLCQRCLKAIEGEVWCPKEDALIPAMGTNLFGNLTSFRKRFLTIQ